MYNLIGDRFLKRFFVRGFHQNGVNPVGEAVTLPAKEADKPDKPGNTMRGNPPDMDTTLEKGQTGDVNQLAVPENRSDQPTTDERSNLVQP